MQELIRVTTNEQGSQVVDAKSLYDFLSPKARFNDWIVNVLSYGFEEQVDFTKLLVKGEIGRPSVSYVLTMDTAKEIAMIQRSEKGKQARQYFIACEKMLREKTMVKPMSTLDMLEAVIKAAREQESRLNHVESRIELIEAKSKTRPDYFTIAGYASLIKRSINVKEASNLGRRAADVCKREGVVIESIPDPRFGTVNTYPQSVLDQLFRRELAC